MTQAGRTPPKEPPHEQPCRISPPHRTSRALGDGAPRRCRSRLRTRRWAGTRARRRHAVDGAGNVHGDHGAVGLWEVDAAAARRGPGSADAGQRAPRRARAQRSQRASARPAAPRTDRLRLSVLQPARCADCRAERRAAVAGSRASGCVGRSSATSSSASASTSAAATGRPSSRAASSSASPSLAPWSANRA